VAFLSLRRELAARRFARLTLAYGLWCTGCAAAELGQEWGEMLADLSLIALGPLSLACAATLVGRPAIAPRVAPVVAAAPLLLAAALVTLHPAPRPVHVAADVFALGCVAAATLALWRRAPGSGDAGTEEARADEAASPEARRVRYVIVAHSIAIGGVLLDVLLWQLSLPRVASLLFPLLYLYAGYLHLTQVRVADLRQLVGNTVALSFMAVGLAAFFAAIRLWVGERLDLFVFNAFVASFALFL